MVHLGTLPLVRGLIVIGSTPWPIPLWDVVLSMLGVTLTTCVGSPNRYLGKGDNFSENNVINIAAVLFM